MKKIDVPRLVAGISLLPFYGYFVAYTYEASYLSAFGIPSFLAQVSINSAILAVIYFTIVFFISTVVPLQFKPYIKKFSKNLLLYPFLLCSLIVAIFAIIISILYPSQLSSMPLIIFFTFSILIFSDFIPPIFSSHSLAEYKNNIIAKRNTKNVNKKSFSDLTKNEYLNLFFSVLFALFFTYALTDSLGDMNARINSQYYVFIKEGETYALIRSYENGDISIKYKDDLLIPGDIYISKGVELTLSRKKLKLPESTKKNSFLRIN